MKLVGLAGPIGAGKTTAADYMVHTLGFRELLLSEPMKETVKTMFNLPHKTVYGSQKEKETPIEKLSNRSFKTITGRNLLQTLGTDWAMKTIHQDVWHWVADERLESEEYAAALKGDGVVIPDIRFDSDAKWIRERGGIILSIVTEGCSSFGKHHESEKGISPKLVDVWASNDKANLAEFLCNIKGALEWGGCVKAKVAKGTARDRMGLEEKPIGKLITDWADKVFPNRTITDAIKKLMLEELPEYLMDQDNAMELGDIGILVYDIANLAGVDLDKAIRDKMEINKQRSWKMDEITGMMSHIGGDKKDD